MYATRKQRTIVAPATIEGVGYWSGRDVNSRVSSGPGQHRHRLCPPRSARLAADSRHDPKSHRNAAANDASRRRCQRRNDRAHHGGIGRTANRQLRNLGRSAGNARLDGSCLPFVEAFQAAGTVEQDAVRRRKIIRQRRPAGRRAELDRSPAVLLGQDDPAVRTRLRQRQSHRPAIAGNLAFAAAFPHESGAQPHVHAGNRGGGHESPGTRAAGHLQGFAGLRQQGPIDNQLRFPDECVRHKMVDMVGDLALAGCDLVGRFVAFRSGHRLNAELVRAIVSVEEVKENVKRCA